MKLEAIVAHTAVLLERGSVHHDDRCPTCAAFWRLPFESQKRVIMDAGDVVRASSARFARLEQLPAGDV